MDAEKRKALVESLRFYDTPFVNYYGFQLALLGAFDQRMLAFYTPDEYFVRVLKHSGKVECTRAKLSEFITTRQAYEFKPGVLIRVGKKRDVADVAYYILEVVYG